MFSSCYYQPLSCKCRVGHSPWSHRRIVCGAYGYGYTWSMVYGGPWWSMVYGGPWWSCAQEDKSKGELDSANASLCGNHFSHSCDVARMCVSVRTPLRFRIAVTVQMCVGCLYKGTNTVQCLISVLTAVLINLMNFMVPHHLIRYDHAWMRIELCA